MTHDKKGITNLDFELAKKIDDVVLWNPSAEDLSLEGTPKDPKICIHKVLKNYGYCFQLSIGKKGKTVTTDVKH